MQRLSAVQDQVLDLLAGIGKWIDNHTEGFGGVVYRAGDNFSKRGMREAAALAYYALFSLFPLVLLVIVIVGWLVGPAATQNQMQDFLEFFMPGDTATELNRNISRFVEQGSSASIVALLGLFWSALGLFSNLEAALSRTFRETKQRAYLRRRINGILMIIALGVLLLANIVTSLLFSFLNLLFLNSGNIWIAIGGTFIPFGFSMGIFAMMYRWIPQSQVGWDAIWPAALLGGVAWELAKRVFVVYLNTLANFSLVYGSIATVMIFMLWTYFTSIILLFFAEFCVSLSDWLRQRRELIPDRNIFAANYYERALRLPTEAENPEA